MVLHGKHIARGLAGLLLAATLGAAALAASATVQSTVDYTRLNFQFDQPAKMQVSGGGRDIILNFDQPLSQTAPELQGKLDSIANGVQQSADGKQIILNLKKNYRVRQFTTGNGVGIDIMASAMPTQQELAEVPKPGARVQAPAPAATVTPTPAAAPAAETRTAAPVDEIKILTPPTEKPAEPVKTVAAAPAKPSTPVKVITPETLKPVEKKPEPKAAPTPAKTEEKPAVEAKVIRVAPPAILTTKKEPAPTPAPTEEEKPVEAPTPNPKVNPAEALGPIANPILTTKEFKPIEEPAATPVVEPAAKPAPKAEEPEPATTAPATPPAAEEVNPAPTPTNPDAPFLVGVKPGKAGTELYFPWQERVGAAVFERGNDIWIAFSKEADANVALLRTVLPKAVVRTEQFGYKGATVLRLTTDGSLHASVGQPKKSYGWTVTLAPNGGTAAKDIPVSGEKDETDKTYLLLAAFDVAEPIRFFDPTIGDLLIVVPTYELGRGIFNTHSTAELTVLRTPQGIAVASLRDDTQTRQDRTGVLFFGDRSFAVSQNLPVLTATKAPVPGVSAASGVMIPYDQLYVSASEFNEALAMRLQDYVNASEATRADTLLALAKLYLGQSMMAEASGYLNIIKEKYPEYYVEHRLAMLSAACNLLTGRVSEATADIAAPELKDFPEAQVWREAISLVAPDPNAANLSIQNADAANPRPPVAETPSPSAGLDADVTEEEEEEEEVGEAAQAMAAADAAGKPAEEVRDAPVATTATAVTAEPAAAGATATPAAAGTPAATAPAPEPMKRAFNYLDFNKSFIQFYPPRIRQRLAIMAADAYLSNGQPEKSVQTYETLNRDGIMQGVQPYAEYMLGNIAASKGKPKEALKIWDRMSRQQEDPYIRARARYSATVLRLEREEITPQEAAEQIERLRMSWRGDGLEREMLQRLIKIYYEHKQYDQTLRAMKYLLQSFPGEVDTLTLAGDMSELFEELFMHGMADDMAPLKSLGLFYEFRELTPIGEKGDFIIQKLADRLAAVDLLERATQLLEHQVRFRVSGEARARVGARLSLLYLLHKEPKRALEVLEITNYGAMDHELKRQRMQLTAQALAENERPEQALALLSNDTSDEGSLLRLDILWGMQDWPNVINTAEDLLGRRTNLTEPLSPRETPVLLKLALAYAFEEEPSQLRYLRDYYMTLVPEGPYKDIFDYLTNDTAPLDADDFQLVAKQISRTESFLDTFKTKIAQGRLSEVAKEPAATAAPAAAPAAPAP